jgi:hypothetical protein
MGLDLLNTAGVSWIEDLHFLVLLHVAQSAAVGAPSETDSLVSRVRVDHGSLLVLHIPDPDGGVHTS